MNIYVGGVSGVGKTTILRRVAQLSHDFEVIHYASALMQAMGVAPGDYDKLHTFSYAQRDQAAAKMMVDLAARQTTKIRLIDAHYLMMVNSEVTLIVKDWLKSLDALVLIEARPEVVWHRLEKSDRDASRNQFADNLSDQERQAELRDYITKTRAEFDRLAKLYQKDHFVLEHNDDDVDRAARQLINFVQTLLA